MAFLMTLVVMVVGFILASVFVMFGFHFAHDVFPVIPAIGIRDSVIMAAAIALAGSPLSIFATAKETA